MSLAKENNFAKVYIEFEGGMDVRASLMAYEAGELMPDIEPVVNTSNQRVYKLDGKMVPCQLVLKYWLKTSASGFSPPERLMIFLTSDSLTLGLNPATREVNWHGDQENIAFQNFRNILYARLAEINKLKIPLNIEMGVDTEDWVQIREKYRMHCFNMNNWIDYQIRLYDQLWVSHFWAIEKKTLLEIYEDTAIQYRELLTHFFAYEDFKDDSLINSMYYSNLMSKYYAYIDLYAMLSNQKISILLPTYLNLVIEKSSKGHPEVYELIVNDIVSFLNDFGFQDQKESILNIWN